MNTKQLFDLINKVKQDKNYLINNYSLEDRIKIANIMYDEEFEEVLGYDLDNLIEVDYVNLLSNLFTHEEARKLYDDKNYDLDKETLALSGNIELKKKAFFDKTYKLLFLNILNLEDKKKLIDLIKEDIILLLDDEKDFLKLNKLDNLINENSESYDTADDYFYDVLCSFTSDKTKFRLMNKFNLGNEIKRGYISLKNQKLISSLSNDNVKNNIIRKIYERDKDFPRYIISNIVKSYKEENKDDAILEFGLIVDFFDEKWSIFKDKTDKEKIAFFNKYEIQDERKIKIIIDSLQKEDSIIKILQNVDWNKCSKFNISLDKIINDFKSDKFKIMAIKKIYFGSNYNFLSYEISDILKNINFNNENIDLMKQYNLFSEEVFFEKFNRWISNIFEGKSREEKLEFSKNSKIICNYILDYNMLNSVFYDYQNKTDKEKLELIIYDKNFLTKIYDSLKFNDNSIDYGNIIKHLYKEESWDTLSGIENIKLLLVLDEKEQEILNGYRLLEETYDKEFYKKFIKENESSLKLEQIAVISKLISRISYSNATEMLHIKSKLIHELINQDNPMEQLKKIEDIYLKNNLPICGKNYLVFKQLHPNFNDFSLEGTSNASPVLKQKKGIRRDIIIFSDMLRSALGSNNRSVKEYLDNLERGNQLFTNILVGNINYNQLSNEEQLTLSTFTKHVIMLYNNTLKGKENNILEVSNSEIENLVKVAELLKCDVNYCSSLKDKIVSMFGHFAGFDTAKDMKNYMVQKIAYTNNKNRINALNPKTLNKGDFVKGIGKIDYLNNILQNGSVAREFLGDSAESDLTPLDTDLSIIDNDYADINSALSNSEANNYGPIWIVLKGDERFNITRDSNGEETIIKNDDLNKIEAFYTGAIGKNHWGIRTGFASSEIDYIICDSWDKRIGLEIAMNGFYIPVVEKSGKLVFSPDDYDKIREKMSGLSYFEENEYKFSESLENDEVLEIVENLEESELETIKKRTCINNVIQSVINELGLNLKTISDGDLTNGSVELIDTGSTGRGTNKPGDGDFDFMMKLDNETLSNKERLEQLKNALLKVFGKEDTKEIIKDGNFRLKNVNIKGLEHPVDIDISFTKKTNKINYSTDEALKDRLKNIKKQSSEKYKLVVANIILAKKVLKEAEAYKPNRGETPQGGLGGVGIENWILQNGGSFKEAAEDFLKHAEGRSFLEFKNSYHIWDFGENHISADKGNYPHDDFISNNMSEDGYNKMISVLKEYINNLNYDKNDVVKK